MAGGYSGSLFDPQGPGKFAVSLGAITGAMGDVVAGVVQMGEKSSQALIALSQQYDQLIQKASESNVSGNGGTAGAPTTSPGGSGAPTWNQPRPPSNSGKTGGSQLFDPGTPSGAALALGSAAVGAAQRFTAANKSGVEQAGISGQQNANWFGGGRGDYMTIPMVKGTPGMGGRGTEAYTVGGLADYVQSQNVLQSAGIRPMTTNKGPATPASTNSTMINQSLNTAVLMNPGMTRTQGATAFASMYKGSTTQSMAAIGITVSKAGMKADPYSVFEQIFQKTYPSQNLQKSLTQDDILNALTPGAPLERNFEAAGLDSSSDLFDLFSEYVKSRQAWVEQNPGKPVPTGSSMIAALKLDQGPYAAKLKKDSRTAQAKSLLAPSQATSDEHLDNAATSLLKVAEQLGGSNTKFGKNMFNQIGQVISIGSKIGAPVIGAVSAITGLVGGGGPGAGVNDIAAVPGYEKNLAKASPAAVATAPAAMSTIGLSGLLAAASGVTASGQFDWYGTLSGGGGGSGAGAIPNFQAADLASYSVSKTSGSGSTGAAATAASASTPGGPLSGSSNIQKGYNFLLGKGLKDFQAAGVIGNLMEESGMNPASVQKGGPGRGIAQWSVGERWNGVLALAKTENKDATDLGVQLDYLWQELTGSEKSSLTALQATTSVDDATASFEKNYERAGIPAMGVRQSNAQKVLAKQGALARGTYNVARTQLALLHKGERVVPAADNFSVAGRYRRLDSGGSGVVQVHKNFSSGAISLSVPKSPTSADFDDLARQFSSAVTRVGAARASRVS